MRTIDDRLRPRDTWTVAIHSSAEDVQPVGAGLVIDEHRVLTCAHVIPRGVDRLWLAFPKAGLPATSRVAARTTLSSALGASTDVAVLTLEQSIPAQVEPAPLRLVTPEDLVDRRWWTFGFPTGQPWGSATAGSVDADLSYGWVRLLTDGTYPLAQGFSGAAIWCPEFQAVVGIAGQAELSSGNGLALSLHHIDTEFPTVGLRDLASWNVAAADEQAQSAWGWSLSVDPEAGRHWRPRARGVSVDAESGHRFRGRRAALTAIVDWMAQSVPDRRVLVVTGSPGVGKSAVLGRVITTADAAIRASMGSDDGGVTAPLGSIACAVHAKGKTALDVAVEIARAASVALPDRVEDLAGSLRQRLTTNPVDRPFTVVVDALDEASSPDQCRLIINAVLLPLATTCASAGVRVIVGTRRQDDGGDLLAAFAGAEQVIDLDAAAYFEIADLAAYAQATLQLVGDERPGSPYADDTVAARVAGQIAILAQGNFLTAGLIARAHGLYDEQPVALADLGPTASVAIALRQYIDRLAPVGSGPPHQALTVLAFAEAPGLSLELWRTALSAFGVTVSAIDLARFAKSSAANFLIESTGDDATRNYRLFHQALNDTLLRVRAELVDRQVDERALARAFIDEGRRTGWAAAPAYLLRPRLSRRPRGPARRAAAGRQLPCPRRPATARPARRPHRHTRRHGTRAAAATHPAGRAGHAHRTDGDAGPHAGPRTDRTADQPRCRRAVPRSLGQHPRPDRTDLPGGAHRDGERGLLDDRRRADRPGVRRAGRHDPTVGAGHRSGRADVGGPPGGRSGPARPLRRATRAVAVCGRGRHRAGVGQRDRIDDPDPGRARCGLSLRQWPRHLGGAGDAAGMVRIWDGATGRLRHQLSGHTGPVLGFCAVPGSGGPGLLASAGWDGSVRLWDTASGVCQRVLVGHRGAVRAVVVLAVRGSTVLASASDDRTIRLWDPLTGREITQLAGHTGGVSSLCTYPGDTADGLVSLSNDDRTLLLWNLETATVAWSVGDRTAWLRAACVIPGPTGALIAAVSNDDHLVRLWNPASRSDFGTATRCGNGWTPSTGSDSTSRSQLWLFWPRSASACSTSPPAVPSE
ncbi:hypothetical protein GCM10027614_07680 [Micromonospora vulcania]